MKPYLIATMILISSPCFADSLIQPEILDGNLSITYFELKENKLSEHLECSSDFRLPLQDLRKLAPQNGAPSAVISACSIEENGKSIKASAWFGAGLLTLPGKNNGVEDRRSTQLTISIGGNDTTVWLTESDLAQRGKNVILQIPCPIGLKNSEASSQWMRISLVLTEKQISQKTSGEIF